MSEAFYYRAWRRLVRALLGIFLIDWRLEGADALERFAGPGLVASNHISNLDPVLLLLLPVKIAFLAKKQLFNVPVFGWCIRKCGMISLNRSVPDSASIRSALATFAAGGLVGVFPEGTRSPDGKLRRGKPGAGMLAFRAKVPVIPVAVLGSDAILPKGALVPRIAQVTIRVGAPVPLDDLFARLPQTRDEEKALYQEIVDRIIDAIAELAACPSPNAGPAPAPEDFPGEPATDEPDAR